MSRRSVSEFTPPGFYQEAKDAEPSSKKSTSVDGPTPKVWSVWKIII